jgi:Protein of unknown function (DUF2874).
MKKTIALPFFAFILSMSVNAKDVPVKQNELPQSAQEFLKNHFNDKMISFASQDKDFFDGEYIVVFTDGTKVEFSKKGEWIEVECKKSPNGVPVDIVPNKIKKYLNDNYPQASISNIEKNFGIRPGYEVKLTSGIELRFNKNGDFKDFD